MTKSSFERQVDQRLESQLRMTERHKAVDDRRREEALDLHRSLKIKVGAVSNRFDECFVQYEDAPLGDV